MEKPWQQEVIYNGNLWDRGGYEMHHSLLAAYLIKTEGGRASIDTVRLKYRKQRVEGEVHSTLFVLRT